MLACGILFVLALILPVDFFSFILPVYPWTLGPLTSTPHLTFLTSARRDYIHGRNVSIDKISTRAAISRTENRNYNRVVGISKNSFSKNCPQYHSIQTSLPLPRTFRIRQYTNIKLDRSKAKLSNGPASLMVSFNHSLLRRSASFLLWGVRVIIHQFTMSLMLILQPEAFLPRLRCNRRFTFIRYETVTLAFIRFGIFLLQTLLLLYFQPSLDFC